jgi:hypothetical protein
MKFANVRVTGTPTFRQFKDLRGRSWNNRADCV